MLATTMTDASARCTPRASDHRKAIPPIEISAFDASLSLKKIKKNK